jgi:hypothetical protein
LAVETLEKDNKAEINPHLISKPQWLFTDNETNSQRLFGVSNYTPYVKDSFHSYVVNGQKDAVRTLYE